MTDRVEFFRLTGGEVYGLMTPLVTTPSGQKIGKSAGNAVWLDSDKTSPFELYQYFLRQRDADVERWELSRSFYGLQITDHEIRTVPTATTNFAL